MTLANPGSMIGDSILKEKETGKEITTEQMEARVHGTKSTEL
jgi:hypothetical protein